MERDGEGGWRFINGFRSWLDGYVFNLPHSRFSLTKRRPARVWNKWSVSRRRRPCGALFVPCTVEQERRLTL